MKTSLLADHQDIQRGSLEYSDAERLEREKFRRNAILLFFILATFTFGGLFVYMKTRNCDKCNDGPPAYDANDYKTQADYYKDIDPHPITVDDNMRVMRVGSPVLSPDGRSAVWAVRQSHMYNIKKATSSIWGIRLQDGENWLTKKEPIQLTRPEWGVYDSEPQWSRDGNYVVFTSNRYTKETHNVQQLWQFSMPSDPKDRSFVKTSVITKVPVDVESFLLSPNSTMVVFSSLVYHGLNMSETVQRDQDKAAAGHNYKIFDALYVRHWDEWVVKRRQPFALSLNYDHKKGFTAVNEPINILNVDSDAPTRPDGGSDEWSFSPNGHHFAFCRQHDERADVAWQTNSDIYIVNFEQIHPRPIVRSIVGVTLQNPARDTAPRFSPNGGTLAYLAHSVPGYESDRMRIMLLNVTAALQDNGHLLPAPVEVTAGWQLSVESLKWAADGESVFAHVLADGHTSLRRVMLTTRDYPSDILIPTGTAGGFAEIPPHLRSTGAPEALQLLVAHADWTRPNELYVWATPNGQLTAITNFNQPLLAKAQRAPDVERFRFTGSNNDTVSGWIMKPANFDNDKSYPVAFLIHGGPQGSWESGWSYRWNPQLYSAQGYGVIMIDFHGSSGYGQDFTDSIRGRYGSWPFEDLIMGLDAALEKYPWMNRRAVAALGASYGGYMVYWMAGHSEVHERFRCLVSHDGMFDIRSFYYSTEELFFPEHDMPGLPWNNSEAYERWNPASPDKVSQWRLPHLVIHGGLDYRISDAQGLSAFTALQRRGVTSRLLYFPYENHWVISAPNQVVWHTEVFRWLAEHTFVADRPQESLPRAEL